MLRNFGERGGMKHLPNTDLAVITKREKKKLWIKGEELYFENIFNVNHWALIGLRLQESKKLYCYSTSFFSLTTDSRVLNFKLFFSKPQKKVRQIYTEQWIRVYFIGLAPNFPEEKLN